jgi:hypothetical protein
MPTLKYLSVARNQDGRLELFRVNSSNIVEHNWQGAPNSGWVGWTPMQTTANLGGLLEAVSNHDGRIELFRGARHCWQMAPNSGWSPWVAGRPHSHVARGGDLRLWTFRTQGIQTQHGMDPNYLTVHVDRQASPSGVWAPTVQGKCGFASTLGVFPTFKRAALVGLLNSNRKALQYVQFDDSNKISDSICTFDEEIRSYYAAFVGADLVEWISLWSYTLRRRWYRGTAQVSVGLRHQDATWYGAGRHNGHLVVCDGVGREHVIYLKDPSASTSRLAWEVWSPRGERLGGDLELSAGMDVDDYTVAVNQDGRVEVFAMSPDRTQVWHRWMVTASGLAWTGWCLV